MKKFLFSTAVLSALVLSGCATTTVPNAEKPDDTVATYKDGKITSTDLYEKMKETYGETTLQQMLIEDVLSNKYGSDVTDESVQAAFDDEKSYYENEDEFFTALEGSGYTEDSYKDIIRYSMLMEATVKANTEFTDEEINKAYEDYVAPITVAHILVTEEDKAKDLIAQLNDGADFATLAKENSEDTGTASKGGEVTFNKGEMVPEFEDAAFALKDGEVTKEPVSSDYGFHIIKMIKKTEKGTLEEEKETIKDSLMTEKLADTEYVSSIVTEVLKDADIKISDKDLENAMDMYIKPTEEETTDSSTEGSDKDSGSEVDSSVSEKDSSEQKVQINN